MFHEKRPKTTFPDGVENNSCLLVFAFFFVSLLEKNLIALILFRYRSKSYLVFPRSMDKSFTLVHPQESDLRINNVAWCLKNIHTLEIKIPKVRVLEDLQI